MLSKDGVGVLATDRSFDFSCFSSQVPLEPPELAGRVITIALIIFLVRPFGGGALDARAGMSTLLAFLDSCTLAGLGKVRALGPLFILSLVDNKKRFCPLAELTRIIFIVGSGGLPAGPLCDCWFDDDVDAGVVVVVVVLLLTGWRTEKDGDGARGPPAIAEFFCSETMYVVVGAEVD